MREKEKGVKKICRKSKHKWLIMIFYLICEAIETKSNLKATLPQPKKNI